jgi:hypothetical protein
VPRSTICAGPPRAVLRAGACTPLVCFFSQCAAGSANTYLHPETTHARPGQALQQPMHGGCCRLAVAALATAVTQHAQTPCTLTTADCHDMCFAEPPSSTCALLCAATWRRNPPARLARFFVLPLGARALPDLVSFPCHTLWPFRYMPAYSSALRASCAATWRQSAARFHLPPSCGLFRACLPLASEPKRPAQPKPPTGCDYTNVSHRPRWDQLPAPHTAGIGARRGLCS